MKIINKLLSVSLGAVLSVSVLPVCAETDEGNAEFDAFMENEFIETMESNYLTMHYTLKDPESYGIEVPEIEAEESLFTDMDESLEEIKSVLEELESFDYDSLSETQQHDYDAVKFTYEITYELYSMYENYYWYFAPSNSIISNYSINMTEFVFYTNEDFYSYVEVLDIIADDIETALQDTIQQAENGYFMSDSALEQTLTDISDFTAKTDDNAIIVDFETDADATDLLTDEEKETLKAQVRDIVINEIIPECEKVAETLAQYEGTGGNQGYYYMDGGLEYYEALLQDTNSTTRTIDEQFDDLDAFVKDMLNEYIAMLQENYNVGEGTVALNSSEDILEYLSENFEEYGMASIPDVTYEVDYLDPTTTAANTAAYYVSAPVDDYENNVIKVNPDFESDSTSNYITLAHEGYPGHLYQHVYYLSTEPNLVRTCYSFLGYTEGWAMFASDLALQWGVLSEDDAQYNIVMEGLDYGVYALLSIAVNGKGWDESDIAAYLEELGLNTEIAADMYDMALVYPETYCSYGYGLARLYTLYQEAMETLGDDFDLEEFNAVILDNGPRTLDSVEEDMEAYLSSAASESESGTVSSNSRTWLYVGTAAVGVMLVIAIIKRQNKESNPLS